VHAQGQIVHFDSMAERAPRNWLLGCNRWLADDIAPQWFVPVPAAFHARYNAIARDYRYWILDRDAPSALWRNQAWHVHKRLDHRPMQEAAQALVGEHDFTSFRAADCQAKSPMRNLQHLQVIRSGDWIGIDIRANAFLHHMVRNIVGTLAVIGRGEAAIDWIAELLRARDRRRAGMTAPAAGLVLRRVHYPDAKQLPLPPLIGSGW
jgi:tRNA pseudouridine38-40 synthase